VAYNNLINILYTDFFFIYVTFIIYYDQLYIRGSTCYINIYYLERVCPCYINKFYLERGCPCYINKFYLERGCPCYNNIFLERGCPCYIFANSTMHLLYYRYTFLILASEIYIYIHVMY
jgi:hypothetical protein